MWQDYYIGGNYRCPDICSATFTSGTYLRQDICAMVFNYVRTIVPGYMCQVICARIFVPGYLRQDICARVRNPFLHLFDPDFLSGFDPVAVG